MDRERAWLMIPQLVERYGANGARAMIDLLSRPGQDPIPGYIVRADACLMEKQYKEAAQLYVQAAKASVSVQLPHKAIGLYEAALLCDPDDTAVLRTELIIFLCKVRWFWRVSDHLQEHALVVNSEKPIEHWLAPLKAITLDLIIQKSLLHYLSSLGNLFTLKVDQAKIVEMVKTMKQKSREADCIYWEQLVKNSSIEKGIAAILK